MDALFHDLRAAARTLLRRPLFVLVAGLSLAIGIGANTAIFPLALFLSALGIYGVLASAVARREIGVRMALGAGAGRVVWLVVRGMLGLALPGLAVGAVLAWLLARVLQAQGFLIGLRAADPLTLGGVALLLSLVVTAASFVPARRAVEVEPARAPGRAETPSETATG